MSKRKRVELGAEAEEENSTKRHNADIETPFPAVATDATTALPALLDLSALSDTDAIAGRFNAIASELLHGHQMVFTDAATTVFDILEIEFYLYKPGVHEDPYTHRSVDQERAVCWCFHRPPGSAVGFRGGTRKGLDISFGNALVSSYFATAAQHARGGILLRAIRRTHDAVVIAGPSLLVDELFRLASVASVHELIALPNFSPFALAATSSTLSSTSSSSLPPSSAHPTPCLTLRPRVILGMDRVYTSPRIGLTPPALTDSGARFFIAPYRAFVCPHLLVTNGRAHTFLGVWCALENADSHEEHEDKRAVKGTREDADSDVRLLRHVARVAAFTSATASRYLTHYRAGQAASTVSLSSTSKVAPMDTAMKTGNKTGKGKSKVKGALDGPATFLRAVGELERILA